MGEAERLLELLEALAENCGADLLRVKGIVNVVEEPARPAVIHGVQHVYHAPQWLARTPGLIGGGGKVGAYRTVSRDSARARWLTGVPEDKKADLIPAGWFDQWADATFATDAAGAKRSPPVLRAPNGTVADKDAYWAAGKPLYDPGEIRVPVLIIHAEWDADPRVRRLERPGPFNFSALVNDGAAAARG